MEPIPIASRAPVNALADVAAFVRAVENLKSLVLWKQELLARRAGLLSSIDLQIAALKVVCEETVAEHPRLAAMWAEARVELEGIAA